MLEGIGGQDGRCGRDPGSQVHGDQPPPTPVGKTPAAQSALAAPLKVAEGSGNRGVHAVCLWLEVTFGLECFSSFVPFVEKGTAVCTFADHLLCAPRVQPLTLSLHVTGLSLCAASSNTWHVCGDLLSH